MHYIDRGGSPPLSGDDRVDRIPLVPLGESLMRLVPAKENGEYACSNCGDAIADRGSTPLTSTIFLLHGFRAGCNIWLLFFERKRS